MSFEDNTNPSSEREFKLQVIHRVMKKGLPKHALVSKDAKSYVEEKAVEFLRSLTKKATEVAIAEKRKKIKGEDLVNVFQELNLLFYKNVLDSFLQVHHGRDTSSTSASTETDFYDDDQNVAIMDDAALDNNSDDIAAPLDINVKDVKDILFEGLAGPDSVSDSLTYFEVPQKEEQMFRNLYENEDIDAFSIVDDTDPLENNEMSTDVVDMADSLNNHPPNTFRDGISTLPQTLTGTDTGRANAASHVPSALATPSWNSSTKSILGFNSSPTNIAEFSTPIRSDTYLGVADADAFADIASPSRSTGHETYPFPAHSWTVPPTFASGVPIPAAQLPSIPTRSNNDTEAFATDAVEMDVDKTRGENGEDPIEQNVIPVIFDDECAHQTRFIDPFDSIPVANGQVSSQQEPNDSFISDFGFDSFDTESLPEYRHKFLDEEPIR